MNASPILTPRAVAHGNELLGFGGIHGQRLFAKHMLARFGCLDGPRHVQMIGQRIINDVDLGIGQQLFVRTVGAPDPQILRRFLRFGEIARRNGGDFRKLAMPHAWNDAAHRNSGHAQNTPAEFFHNLSCQRLTDCNTRCYIL